MRERKRLRDHIHQIMWFMRGSISREEAWALSPEERRDLMAFIEERMKFVEKTGLSIL